MQMRSVCILILLSAFISCTQEKKPAEKFIETAYMDSSVKPGDNFFLFINGKWYDTAKISSTESGAGSVYDLLHRTRANLHSILDSVSEAKQTKGSIEQ